MYGATGAPVRLCVQASARSVPWACEKIYLSVGGGVMCFPLRTRVFCVRVVWELQLDLDWLRNANTHDLVNPTRI
jgi:hypothetical protein